MRNKYTPEVRFTGYEKKWNERKLSELMEFSNGINAPKENYGKGRKMISVMDILAEERIVYENIRNSVEVDERTESKNKVENGDLIFVRSSEILDEVGWTKAYQQEKYALYSGFSIRGKRIKEFEAKFIELSINYRNRKQIESKAGGSTRFNVSQSILNSVVILEPSIEEQKKIGNFFEQLEDTIALHQQDLATFKQTKQGFLQKMFPKEGESVPEVRFPGFSGDWEEHKLGELISIKSGWSPSSFTKSDDPNSSLFIKVDDLNYSSREQIESHMKVNDNPRFIKMKKGSTIFPKRGAAIMTNKVRILDSAGYMDTNMMALEPESISGDFLYTFIEKTGLYKIADTSTIPQINNKHIEPYVICLPRIDEQEKVGKFFKRLDDTIALYQRELDILKETKKAFLQKMFV